MCVAVALVNDFSISSSGSVLGGDRAAEENLFHILRAAAGDHSARSTSASGDSQVTIRENNLLFAFRWRSRSRRERAINSFVQCHRPRGLILIIRKNLM